jgi:prolyl oligopeptidase
MHRILWLPAAVLMSATASPPPVPPGPPPSPRKPVTDTYFGSSVRDDYRWLEDSADPAVQAWSEAQNAYARAVLDALPAVPAIRARARQIADFPSPTYSSLEFRGGTLFAIKTQPPRQQAFLVALSSPDEPASERALVDPNAIDPKGTTAIDFFVPSLDGRLVAVSLSEGGSEEGTVFVYETASGRRLSDVVPRVNGGTAGGGLAWNADGSGFHYTRYPRPGERPPEDLAFFQQVYFHRLGTPTEKDGYELGADFPRIAETTLRSSDDGRFVLATVKNGDGGDAAQYLRAPEGRWAPVAGFSDGAIRGRFGPDGSLYLLSRKGAPRGRLLRLPPGTSDLSRARVVVPEGDASIDDFCATAARVYVVETVGGPSRIRAFGLDGAPAGSVPLLPISSVSGLVPFGHDRILFENQSDLVPPAWYRTGTGGQVERTALRRASPVDFSDTEVILDFADSADGTRVPLRILRLKGSRRDGSHPALLYGYGGYGITQRPVYSPLRRIWIEQGGVYAVAGLRGGGEYGDAWHRAGNLTRKQNVFEDFAACARHLIAAGYVRPSRLAIEGGSNGGLLMGAALTQQPELFGAVVAHVGIFDMLRVELSANGAFNVTEFGTVTDPEQFRALYAYSPYHHVRDGLPYPPVLFLTGANDARVDPMQSRKMTARLQAAGGSGGPFLLRTSSSSGHGFGSSLDERVAQTVDVYAFLFDRLGVAYHPVTGGAAPPSSPESGTGTPGALREP